MKCDSWALKRRTTIGEVGRVRASVDGGAGYMCWAALSRKIRLVFEGDFGVVAGEDRAGDAGFSSWWGGGVVKTGFSGAIV
jgi:hypothetical protein